MRLLRVPAASFELGLSTELEARVRASDPLSPFPFHLERPAHRVEVAAFEIGEAPVTNAEYAEFVAAGGYRPNPKVWEALLDDPEVAGARLLASFVDQTGRPGPLTWRDGSLLPGTEDHPVSGVSWFEAQAFCASRKLRLPKESEWELAARGRDGRLYPWGDAFDAGKCGNAGDPPPRGTRPVSALPEGRSPYGLLHAVGNVAQWCQERFGPYPGAADVSGAFALLDRVVRGDFYNGDPTSLRVTVRSPQSPELRFAGLGFRCAATSGGG